MLIYYGVLIVIGLGLLIAVFAPYGVVYFGRRFSADLVANAKGHFVFSICLLVVAIGKLLGISLINHTANILITLFAAYCYFFLVQFAFESNIRLFKVPIIGLLPAVSSVLLLLYFLAGVLSSEGPMMPTARAGIYCQRSMEGMVGAAQSETWMAFKRYFIVDKLMASSTLWYNVPGEDKPTIKPADGAEYINLCRAVFTK